MRVIILRRSINKTANRKPPLPGVFFSPELDFEANWEDGSRETDDRDFNNELVINYELLPVFRPPSPVFLLKCAKTPELVFGVNWKDGSRETDDRDFGAELV